MKILNRRKKVRYENEPPIIGGGGSGSREIKILTLDDLTTITYRIYTGEIKTIENAILLPEYCSFSLGYVSYNEELPSANQTFTIYKLSTRYGDGVQTLSQYASCKWASTDGNYVNNVAIGETHSTPIASWFYERTFNEHIGNVKPEISTSINGSNTQIYEYSTGNKMQFIVSLTPEAIEHMIDFKIFVKEL